MDIQGGVLWIYLLVDVHLLTFHIIVTTTSEIATLTSEWIVMWSSIYLCVL